LDLSRKLCSDFGEADGEVILSESYFFGFLFLFVFVSVVVGVVVEVASPSAGAPGTGDVTRSDIATSDVIGVTIVVPSKGVSCFSDISCSIF